MTFSRTRNYQTVLESDSTVFRCKRNHHSLITSFYLFCDIFYPPNESNINKANKKKEPSHYQTTKDTSCILLLFPRILWICVHTLFHLSHYRYRHQHTHSTWLDIQHHQTHTLHTKHIYKLEEKQKKCYKVSKERGE